MGLPPRWSASLLILSLLFLYYCSYHVQRNSQNDFIITKPPATPPQPLDDIDQFVATSLRVQVDDPFNISSITELCASSPWQPQIVLNLDDANGGIGNVRGNILDFVFFAIVTGSSIILPHFASRSTQDISSLWAGTNGFDTFFDTDTFVNTLSYACPRMKIYTTDDEVANLLAAGTVKLAARYAPPSFRTDIDPAATVDAGRGQFEGWLNEQPELLSAPSTSSKSYIVNLSRTLWDGPDTGQYPSLRHSFGRILQLRRDVRRLAAQIIHAMAVKFSLPIDPSSPLHPNAFFGAHLRTESDAAAAGWLSIPHANFSAQTSAYEAQAYAAGLKVLYVASGSQTELERFRGKAWRQYGMNVTWKHDLLGGEELRRLQKMTWDQQALVDYEVLMKASVFGGFVKSSFSWNIAVRRHEVMGGGGLGFRVEDPYSHLSVERDEAGRHRAGDSGDVVEDGTDWKGIAFDDGLSRVWGRDEWHELKIPKGMWP